jgi:Ser/Thr protein kinase RdoA (MazF antagonist)
VRLVTWLAGAPLDVSADHPLALLEDVGRRVGELDRALATFDHPAIHRDFYWDLARAAAIVDDGLALVADPDLRRAIAATRERFARETAPLGPSLRTGAIHNDANEHNVLVCDGRVSGIIDFGDMVHGWTVGDLAIATAYAVLDQRDLRAAVAALARGYEAEYPLLDVEREALMGLVRLRLAVSICIAEAQRRERPDDAYLTISQAPIRRTLPRLIDLRLDRT